MLLAIGLIVQYDYKLSVTVKTTKWFLYIRMLIENTSMCELILAESMQHWYYISLSQMLFTSC